MKSEEKLRREVKLWDGVNRYIVRDAQRKLRKLEQSKEEVVPELVEKRLAEIKEDLLDDGKLNHSNDPKKKSPGRRKKK